MDTQAVRAWHSRSDNIVGGMPAREVLEKLNTTWLAVLCGHIAEDPRIDNAIAENAWELRREWALLQIPPPPSFKEHEENQAKQEALRVRMLDFLSGF